MQFDSPQVLLGIHPWLERNALRFRFDFSSLAPRLAKNNPKRRAFRTLPELIPLLKGNAEFEALTRSAKSGKFTSKLVGELIVTVAEACQCSLMFRELHPSLHPGEHADDDCIDAEVGTTVPLARRQVADRVAGQPDPV